MPNSNESSETMPPQSSEQRKNPDVCPVCLDARQVHPCFPSGKPDYSRTVTCSCWRQRYEVRTRPDKTFATLRKLPGLAEAIKAAQEFAVGNITFLLVYGGYGNGKTHLCEATAQEIAKHRPVELWTMADLLTAMRQKINNNTLDAFVVEIERKRCLILDDMGDNFDATSGKASAWAIERIAEIVDYRYRELLPMMLTTNLDLAQIPQRMRGRFSELPMGRVVLNYAPNFRML